MSRSVIRVWVTAQSIAAKQSNGEIVRGERVRAGEWVKRRIGEWM